MTKINDLSTKDQLESSDKFVIWDGATRAITAQNAASYYQSQIAQNFQPADVTLTAIAALQVGPEEYIEATGVDTFRARKLTVLTYADLTAIPTQSRHDDMLVYVSSRATDGDGADGYWRFDSGSSATANGGTILAPDAGFGRWFRLWDLTATRPEWFGDCSTATGAHAAITAAINYWAPFSALTTGGGSVVFASRVYTISEKLDVTDKHGITLLGAGPLATEIKANGNFPVIEAIGDVSEPLNKFFVKNMMIRGGGKNNVNAHGISWTWVNGCGIENVIMYGCRHALDLYHNWQTKLDYVYVHGAGSDQNYIGIYQGETTITAIDNAVIATGCVWQGCEASAQRLINGQGSKFTSCEFITSAYGTYMGEPGTGTVKSGWVHWVNCLWDSNTTENFYAKKGLSTQLAQWMVAAGWSGNSSGHGALIDGAEHFSFELAIAYYNIKSSIRLENCLRCNVAVRLAQDWNREASGANNWPCVGFDDTTYSTITIDNGYTSIGTPKSFLESGTSNYNKLFGDAQFGLTLVGSDTLPLLANVMARIAGLTFESGAIFRHGVDNGALVLAGGSTNANGANVELYGGSVGAGLDNNALVDADIVRFRSQAGSEFGRLTASTGKMDITTGYQVGGVDVLGGLGAAIADVPTGGSATAADNAAAINNILARMRAKTPSILT